MSWPATMEEGRTVNAMRELDWAKDEATSDAQTKRALAKYIAMVVGFGGGEREGEEDVRVELDD